MTQQPGVKELTQTFVNTFGELPIKGLEELSLEQLVWLERFKTQNKQMQDLNQDLSEVAKIYSSIPEYITKLEQLKSDMENVSSHCQELKERALNVQYIKDQRRLADAQLLAQPANSLNTGQ